MNVVELAIPEVLVLEPRVFGDDRGFFMESWNRTTFREATGIVADFVQDNHSRSSRGVLRGLHFQLPPHAQGKLLRVARGTIFDVAVDIRRHSRTFAQWVGVELSADNHRQIWIPPGFAHGFLAMTDVTDLLYKTTDYYSSESDAAVRWDDKSIGIAWPLDGLQPILSDKDDAAPLLSEADVFD